MEIERRAYVVDGLKVEERDGQPAIIRGHAAVFNALSSDLGGFQERILPGAFAQAILEDDVRALINHDPSLVIGRKTAGTLRMAEDGAGLAVEIDPPDTQYARDLLVSIKRGDISGMSFGFQIRKGGQSWDRSGSMPLRSLSNVRLLDVSPVTYPAYPQTEVAVRSLNEFRQAEQEAQRRRARLRMRLELSMRAMTG